jgi:hypothetical protein
MPLVIGGMAIAFVALVLLTLIVTYWVLTRMHDYATTLIFPLNQLAGVADWLRNRNLEILHSMADIAHSLIIWSIERMNDGFKLLHDAYSAITLQPITNAIIALQKGADFVTGTVYPLLTETYRQLTDIQRYVHGFVDLNIAAFTFWQGQIDSFNATFVIPNINGLIKTMNDLTGLTIPFLTSSVTALNRQTFVTLPAEIAETKTDVSAVQRVIDQTTTAPGTGLLDRATALEGQVAQVLPWAAAIGLSIPLARTLGRVARNPCTCLEEQGQTDIMPLLMYLFEEAG